MKNIWKRTIALLLAVIMIGGSAPLSTLAEMDWPTLSAGFVSSWWNSGLNAVKSAATYLGNKWHGLSLRASAANYSGTCRDNLTWALDTETGELVISGVGDMYNYGNYDIYAPWYSYRSYVKTVAIGNSVTSIGDHAFYLCTGLTSVTIPDSVTSIGVGAFNSCTGLTSVTIPDSVTSIGNDAFWLCTGLTSVIIPDRVTSIGDWTFYGCKGLTSVNIPDRVTSIGWAAFAGCNGLTSVTIPESVTSISSQAFHACTRLTSITIPDSVTRIGFNVFGGTEYYNNESNWIDGVLYIGKYLIQAKTSISGAYNVKAGTLCIGDESFKNCTGLTSVTIGRSVTSIGGSVFQGCTGLASVTIGKSVTSIGGSVFQGCTGLASVTIGKSVTSIGGCAFYGCTGLTSVTIPDSVTSIGDYAFYGCTGLTSVTIGKSVTSIGGSVFQGCTGLASVTIPDSVTSIGFCAFYDCTGLKDVYYTGTQEQWNSISMDLWNEALKKARIHYLQSYTSPSEISSANSGHSVSAFIDSIRIVPREADASIKLNAANLASDNINFTLKNVTAEVGGKTFTQNSKNEIVISSAEVTGDITIKKNGYYDYVIPLAVYNSFTTASLNNILDYEAYMSESDGTNRVYVSTVFGRVSESGDSYVELTRNTLKIIPDESYDFYITALNTADSTLYNITQDDAHKIKTESSGSFTSSTIGSDLVNGKTAYAYVTSGGKQSKLVPLRLDVEQGGENWFVEQLKRGTLSLGGSSGVSIKLPESWVLVGGSELNIVDFNIPVSVDITGNKIKGSLGFDFWKKTTTQEWSNTCINPNTQENYVSSTFITEKESGVITDGVWKTVKDGLKDAGWSWKNAETKSQKTEVKKRLADRYGIDIGELGSSNQKRSGFNVSFLGYIEGEIVGNKFIMTDFMLSCSGSFTISYTHQMAVGYFGIEGSGKVTVSFNASRNAADELVDFDLSTGVQVTPKITPRAGLGFDGVASVGVYGTASMPLGLTFSFTDKALTGSIKINGEIGYEAQFLIWKTGRKSLVRGTLGPWKHTWNFGQKSTKARLNTELPEETLLTQGDSDIALTPIERCNPSAWFGETKSPVKNRAKSAATQAGATIANLQTDVFSQSEAKIISCGDSTIAAWTAEDPDRDEFNRLCLVYSVYDAINNTWSEPKAVYDDGHVDSTPYLAADGSDIYIVWQKYIKEFNSTNNVETPQDILCSSEIYLAKYDAQNDMFVQPTRLTNNSSYDYSPVVAVNNGAVTVYYATNPENTLISAGGNSISKCISGTSRIVKTDLATVTGMECAVVNGTVRLAYSTDTDGDIETTNDINVFYGTDSFSEVPTTDEYAENSIKGFTYAKIGDQKKLLYTDGINIYYESDGKSVPILEDNDTNISGRIYAVENGSSTDLFWFSQTEYGNDIYSASYRSGEWSNAVAVTSRGSKLSNLALTCVNNTLLGVANETLVTQNPDDGTYIDGETNLISIIVNDFVDLKADDIDIIEYDKSVGELTGIGVTVTNKGRVKQNRLHFSINDSKGAETAYYVDTELKPGNSELYWIPYQLPESFSGTNVSVYVSADTGTDINSEDNAVTYTADRADILASDLPVTYLKDGCILSAEIVNYNFTEANNIIADVYFEEGGVTVSENQIRTIDKNSKAKVEFAFDFDDLPFDESNIAKVYMEVTADNAESTTLTFIVEKDINQCAHPQTEDLGQIEPTCTEDGYCAGAKCLGCGEYVSGGELIPATGHTVAVDGRVEPTCTETGLTEGSHCSVCGVVLTEREEIPALWHDYANGVCTRCGIEIPSICAGETKTVTITDGHISYLKFVPEATGIYTFASNASSSTYIYLYDADLNQITYQITHYGENNFSYGLLKGVTYYFGCNYRSETSGSYDVMLAMNETEDIYLHDEKDVVVTGGEVLCYKFIPEQSGTYYFYGISSSEDLEYSTSAILYNENMEQLADGSYYGYNGFFKISYELLADETYYFDVRIEEWIDSAEMNIILDDDYAVDSIEIGSSPIKLDYFVGDRLDTTGLELWVDYIDGTFDILYSGYTCDVDVLDTEGEQTVTVSYKGKTATFNVFVEPKTETPHVLVLPEGSDIVIDEARGSIYGIPTNMKADDFEALFTVPQDGYVSVMTSGRFVGTGSVLAVHDSHGEVLAEYTVVIFGDLDGNGRITAADISVAQQGLVDGFEDEIFEFAANIVKLSKRDRFNALDVSALYSALVDEPINQAEIAQIYAENEW